MNSQGFSSIKVSLLAIASVVLLGAWVFLAYKSGSYKDELAVIEAETRNKSSESSYLISVKNALRDAKDDIALVEGRFIDKDSVPDFINLLEGKVADARVKANFGSINVDAKGLSIGITGSGTWNDVIGFISTIDSLPYALRIDGIGLQKLDATGDSKAGGIWNFTLSLVQHVSTEKK